MSSSQTPDEAKEELRTMCIRAWEIAHEQGWDATIDGRPHGKEGYSFAVYTDTTTKPSDQLTLKMDGDQ